MRRGKVVAQINKLTQPAKSSLLPLSALLSALLLLLPPLLLLLLLLLTSQMATLGLTSQLPGLTITTLTSQLPGLTTNKNMPLSIKTMPLVIKIMPLVIKIMPLVIKIMPLGSPASVGPLGAPGGPMGAPGGPRGPISRGPLQCPCRPVSIPVWECALLMPVSIPGVGMGHLRQLRTNALFGSR